ncbi:MAG: SMC-Scp complex subunit ScpB [Candidatus Buchananbacteria bacterium]
MNLKNIIESLLFISHKPLSVAELAKLSENDKAAVAAALKSLQEEYRAKDGGIEIINIEDKYQMAAAGESSEAVAKFLKTEVTGELTRPSLETLTIIAYRGPVSKAELELIRGVNCSLILRNLLMRGLIESREDKDKAVTVYQITFDFLKHLGLGSVSELPDYERLNRNNNLEKLLLGLTGGAAEQDIPADLAV